MMHTPEEKALIEAVGVWREEARRHEPTGALATAICATYDAYMASLTTPPSCLPPAPKGERWVRVEYPNSWADAQNGDCLVYLLGQKALAYTRFDYSSYTQGLAQALRYGWRLVDDPEADSLEKIADELAAVSRSGDHADYAKRIRALIGERQK